MAGEMSTLAASRPASAPDSAEACGSAAVARALGEFSDARSKALTRLTSELEKLSDGMTGTLEDVRALEEETIASLRSLEARGLRS